MKKTLFPFCLLIAAALSGLSAFAQSAVYKGTVGKLPIYLELSAENSGSYFYQKTIIEIPFSGTRKGTDLSLTTYDDMEESTAEHFHLKASGNGWKGTWSKNGKVLPVTLTKLTAAELTVPRIVNNPLLKAMEIDDLSKMKIGLFRLKSLDSIGYADHVKLRYFQEIHTNLTLFRVDSGLPQAKMDWANQLLEQLHIQSYLGYGECSYGGINFEYDYGTSDYCINGDFLSFIVSGSEYCGGAHPNYYSYPVNIDLVNKHDMENTDFLISIADSTAVDDEDGLTNWQLHLMDYFRRNFPDDMSYDEESDDCNYSDPNNWMYNDRFVITHEGLRIMMTFPHVLTICNDPEWTIIPFADAKKYLKPEIYARLMKIKP